MSTSETGGGGPYGGSSSILRKIEPPDSYHLLAASGWIDLGNYQEASKELGQTGPDLRNHPEVLKVQWQFCVAACEWDRANEIALTLRKQFPEDPFGWIYSACVLHGLGRTEEAYEALLSALNRFPNHAVIHYKLACFAVGLGEMEWAQIWFKRGMVGENVEEIKAKALKSPDLQSICQNTEEFEQVRRIWEEI